MGAARPLGEYRRKRDFRATREPAGAPPRRRRRRRRDPRFVVQEHSATSMHWDLRLEHEGVLLSWAVPKGIPADPADARLAIRTEDHPLEYLDFEGEIPAGSYGAGTMSIWDRGTYELEELDDGKVHVRFSGERTNGRYVLVRTRGGGGDPGPREQWLLRRLDPPDDPDRVRLPEGLQAMAATTGRLPRRSSRWAWDVAWGGERVVVEAAGGRVVARTAGGEDVAPRFPELARLGRALGWHEAVIDGELVVVGADARPDRELLASRLVLAPARAKNRAAAAPARLLALDLLHLDGRSLLDEPWSTRRDRLRALLPAGESWEVPPEVDGPPTPMLRAVAAQGLAGIVAKRVDSPYRPGERSGDWVFAPAPPA